jgi:hypothetical protein
MANLDGGGDPRSSIAPWRHISGGDLERTIFRAMAFVVQMPKEESVQASHLGTSYTVGNLTASSASPNSFTEYSTYPM